jgi:hypothetical protein
MFMNDWSSVMALILCDFMEKSHRPQQVAAIGKFNKLRRQQSALTRT